MAGVVSVQTKSGTNEFHGSAFEFLPERPLPGPQPVHPARPPDPLTGRSCPRPSATSSAARSAAPSSQNKFFFFGDYQGSRSTVGGSRLLTVPTAAARTGDLSEYGVNIFDPAGGAPGSRPSSRATSSPRTACRRRRCASCSCIPLPNTGRGPRQLHRPGLRDLRRGRGDVRLDGRLSDRLNVFGRYSLAHFDLDGPTAFGPAAGEQLVSLGGVSKVRNHSVAVGVDYTLNSTTILDVRFGFFKYRVDVLPFDFGTTPAADAGIPGLNLTTTSPPACPPSSIDGGPNQMEFGSGLEVNRCNCPLAQHEKQCAGRHQPHQAARQPHREVRASTSAGPTTSACRATPTGRASCTSTPRARQGRNGGGLGLATFLLGDVTRFSRYVSPSTDARERQWRHFYYVQDTWRACPKLTLNYGLRARRHPSPDRERGRQRRLARPRHRRDPGGRRRRHRPGRQRGEQGQLGAPPRRDLPVRRRRRWCAPATGAATTSACSARPSATRSRRTCPCSSFQNLNPPNNFDSVFNLAQGPPPPVFRQCPPAAASRCRTACSRARCPRRQTLPAVDA